jgi:hypothetical protein
LKIIIYNVEEKLIIEMLIISGVGEKPKSGPTAKILLGQILTEPMFAALWLG